MHGLDWAVLVASLVFIVAYGVWKGRGLQDVHGYLLAGRNMRWTTIGLAVIATQASAITFLSTPGQAYVDGIRFVQFYFGQPLAVVLLCMVAVPLYHRLKVYTAYEFLEARLDLKTRLLTALLFLLQRGLAAGLTIYAPAIILSVLLGWDMHTTILLIGGLVIVYTAVGGTRSVNLTQSYQMLIIFGGIGAAFVALVARLPDGVSLVDATVVAGKLGRMRAVDLSFDWENRYTLWSGLIGGMFLALSYFGTDQSQVQRYLTGQSIAQSRLGLLMHGFVKVPMQFAILFIGAMVFAFYQFVPPPVFFNPVEVRKLEKGPWARDFERLKVEFYRAWQIRKDCALRLIEARRQGDPVRIELETRALRQAEARVQAVRQAIQRLMERNDPKADTRDVNYVFLTFVLHHLPPGIVGLMLAVVFAASMSSTSSELNALASTTVVDLYRRVFRRSAHERHYVWISRAATVFWGGFAILFAEYAHRLGALVEAVNILGSLFYGTILGIFVVAAFMPWVGGTATFLAALLSEGLVFFFYTLTPVSWLWLNVIGCLGVVLLALVFYLFTRSP